MNTNITLNHYIATETLIGVRLSSFSNLVLKCARSKLIRLPSGQLLMQSIGNYLLNVDLFDYNINLTTNVSLNFKKPSVIMVVMLNGHSALYDDTDELLKESHGNFCYLSYIAPGNYTRSFLGGMHQILLLTIPERVLENYAKRYYKIIPILDRYQSNSSEYLTLANAPIAKGILKLLHKLNNCSGMAPGMFDKKMSYFLHECMENYNKSLEQDSIYDELQKEKAEEIARFLGTNYSNEIVNDKAKLAAHFCISETTMLRLAKKRFGKSLHQHVVELRLLYGLKQLITSDRSIKEIAESVGYTDPFHFSRAFKQHFNISPSKIDNLRVRS